jgi:hypothetical protein
MAVFWIFVPCSLVDVYRRFRAACCCVSRTMMVVVMEAASISETSLNVYQTTRRNNQKGSHLHTHSCGVLKFCAEINLCRLWIVVIWRFFPYRRAKACFLSMHRRFLIDHIAVLLQLTDCILITIVFIDNIVFQLGKNFCTKPEDSLPSFQNQP